MSNFRKIIAALIVGAGTFAAASSAAEPFAYVANLFSDNVSVIDTATNTIVTTVPVAGVPNALVVTPDGTFVYVASQNSDNVSVIETATNTIVETVPVGTTPAGLAITSDGAFVYVANFNDLSVSVIETATNTVMATVPVGTGPRGMDVTSDGAFVYVANFNDRSVSVIETATNTEMATVAVGVGPNDLAITPDGSFVYVANANSDNVSVIETATNTVMATVPVGDIPRDVAITTDGAFVYVVNQGSDNVSVIDTATNTVVDTVTLGFAPTALALSPDGAFVYVANAADDNVSVIETATKTVVATVPVGDTPIAVAIGPASTIDESLVGHWNFDSGAGSEDALDSSANSNDGVFAGNATRSIDHPNIAGNVNSLSLDGTGDDVLVGDPLELDLSGDLTVSAWIKTDGNLTGGQGIAAKWNYIQAEDAYGIFIFPSGGRVVLAGGIGKPGSSDGGFLNLPENNVPLNQWVHVAMTYESTFGGNLIFIDGAEVGSRTRLGGPNYNSPANFRIGNLDRIATYFKGNIDDVRVYDRALTPEEIADLASGGIPNEAPTADAGGDQAIRAGDIVNLDGSASFDDNTSSAALLYAWTFASLPAGSAAILFDADTATPSFTVDIVGTYTLQLTVTDEGGLPSVVDQVDVGSNNLAPTAVAGDDQLVLVDSTVDLNGLNSSDPEDDILTYAWSISSAPVGSIATLANANSETPDFTPDLEGAYGITLVVSDFLGAGDPGAVTITAAVADEFAEVKIVEIDAVVEVLDPDLGEVTNGGNLGAYGNFLTQAMVAIQEDDIAAAIDKLEKAIGRTDGCALRGDPDVRGQGKDWITDCDVQAEIYPILIEALNALTQ